MVNDLLDPRRGNLKLREDPKRGFFIEGIKEETLVSAEHALSIIAAGDAHRKAGIILLHGGWHPPDSPTCNTGYAPVLRQHATCTPTTACREWELLCFVSDWRSLGAGIGHLL